MSTQFKLREVGFQVRYINSYLAFSSKLFTQSAVLFTPWLLISMPPVVFDSHFHTLGLFFFSKLWQKEQGGERGKESKSRLHLNVSTRGWGIMVNPSQITRCVFFSWGCWSTVWLSAGKILKSAKAFRDMAYCTKLHQCSSRRQIKLLQCVCFLVFFFHWQAIFWPDLDLWLKKWTRADRHVPHSTQFPLSGVQPVLERRPLCNSRDKISIMCFYL